MPKTEQDPLGPGFQWRLRNALDRLEPRWSTPRYQQAQAVRPWRAAPLALAAGVTGVLALAIYAAAGSATPSDIEHRIVTVIQNNQEPSPTPPPPNNPTAPPQRAAPVPAPSHAQQPSVSKPTAEPSERQEPGESSNPSDRSQPRPTPSPSPSPEPGDH